ncbi:MAG: family RecB-like putative nuclease [Gemmatimonadetes bacterium]|nr:family RecB-like putative nuclease [Gemmatimonadota bacterium]
MQRLPDGSFRFSPRDLISYLEGDFAAWCDRNHAETSSQQGKFTPDVNDEEMELVIRRGLAHEAAHLEHLRSTEPHLVEIARTDTAYHDTQTAMRSGAPIIFQGELRAGAWMGIADFLHRVDGPSALGDYFYEPWDTKLARSAKPYFLLQLCAYADMLEASQQRRPHQFGFILGDNAQQVFRTDDVWHYFRRIRKSFETFHDTWDASTHPDPSLDRTHGRWSDAAEKYLERVDDLSLVAGIGRGQIVRLRDGGIHTLTALATTPRNTVPRMNAATFTALRAQAEMQVASRKSGKIEWKFRALDADRPRRGLALLPPASPNDIFFDIEGFPYAPGGLEYLLGVVTLDEGAPQFRDWWAHDNAAEKIAFEQFIDWAYARWLADPTLHIYHYASYERSALGRLMGKYATREFEVDQLFRHHVLVDLYPAVLQGMVIGTPSYSLKYVEHLYMPKRTGEVTSAGGSVVEYQRWIDNEESPDPDVSPTLGRIRRYNKVDCESTVGLRDWLLERQKEAGVEFIVPDTSRADEFAAITPAQQLATQLLARDAGGTTDLLAWLLEFHRREEKPWWWQYFDRMIATEDKLYHDADCLAGLVRTATPSRTIKRSTGLEYSFDPDQDTRISDGESCAIPGTEDLKCTVETFVDREAGLVELKVGPGKSIPDRLSLIPASLISGKTMAEGILRFVTRWSDDDNCSAALADLLARRAPRLTGGVTMHIDDTADLAPQAIAIVRALDNSALCIQGPPGTGKTTIASRVILALVSNGKRVGIVANGHQVILNLMECIAKLGDEQGLSPALVKVTGDKDHPLIASGRMSHIESKEALSAITAGPLVIGGTAWCFARPELECTLDYLFIEEAGQFSLANAVAVGSAAKNLVLLGDQMQLAQPTQGSHPGESGLSALEYFLHGHATVPPALGIFLGLSHRMHPDVCRVISDAYYEGRLKSAPLASSNQIIGAAESDIGIATGVRFIPVNHDGCTQDSDEEVCTIETLVKTLLACSVQVKGKPPRAMAIEDILVVAPFNMQVRALKRRLGNAARVGSVDRFQGQEAPVVIVSMCASTLDDAPRGPKFLLSKNRLNVAVSRAQALAIIVGSPRLGDVRVKSVEEMLLVSGWCRLEECVRQLSS